MGLEMSIFRRSQQIIFAMAGFLAAVASHPAGAASRVNSSSTVRP
jgi:hypothetical protein